MTNRIAAVLAFLALQAVEVRAADPPAAAVEAFYAAFLDVRPSGLPSAAEMQRLGPLMSPKLASLLRDSLHVRAELTRSWPPDSKPPLVDGCLFASLFEGPHAVKVLEVGPPTDDRRRVLVELTYFDPYRPGERSDWKDAVWVIESNGTWLVDDVEYLGDWDFMIGQGTTLVAMLEAVVRNWTKQIGAGGY